MNQWRWTWGLKLKRLLKGNLVSGHGGIRHVHGRHLRARRQRGGDNHRPWPSPSSSRNGPQDCRVLKDVRASGYNGYFGGGYGWLLGGSCWVGRGHRGAPLWSWCRLDLGLQSLYSVGEGGVRIERQLFRAKPVPTKCQAGLCLHRSLLLLLLLALRLPHCTML